VDPKTLYAPYNISVPIDHFHNSTMYEPHSSGSYDLTYYFDAQYYKPGGPVILLATGEDSGSDRLPYLQKGILHQLAQATNGVGVVLEHRYYGLSFPTADLSTHNLRFLTTEQALEDYVYFANNIQFPGLEQYNLTASHTPYIAYGGSYAGAFVAFLRTLYPGTYFGSISSSGVTEAIYDFWHYYEPIRKHAPRSCVHYTQVLTHMADAIIFNNTAYTPSLKTAFGTPNITNIKDFGALLAGGITGWQSTNWNPAVGSPAFFEYCGNITSDTLIYPATKDLTARAQTLLAAGGYRAQTADLTNHLLNWIGYLRLTQVTPCAESNSTQDECFNVNPVAPYQDTTNANWGYRSWTYQYCMQWGYFQTGSGVPAAQLPLVSRTQDLEYEQTPCRIAFNYTGKPDIAAINKYGGRKIAYPRLAIVGGQNDPWRDATPLAEFLPLRPSTPDEPVVLIHGAVHHWDENGIFPNETTATLPPQPIVDAQSDERTFVLAWLKEWKGTSS